MFYHRYVLEKVDLVIVGAEGVVESGGIINKVRFRERLSPLYRRSPDQTHWCLQIGTYQMAMCSKAHNKPFYVVAESFKFVRLYPLNQQDVPDKFKVRQNRTYVCMFTAFPLHRILSPTVQSRHAEDRQKPVRGAPDGRLHASLPHHPPLHWPGCPHSVCSQWWAH